MTDSAIVADADLTIRTGPAEGHLSGSGSHLTFSTSHLSRFLGAAPRSSRDVIHRLSSGLASNGVSISVIEDGAVILDIGDVKTSIIARVFGYRNVRVRRPLHLLTTYLQR